MPVLVVWTRPWKTLRNYTLPPEFWTGKGSRSCQVGALSLSPRTVLACSEGQRVHLFHDDVRQSDEVKVA